MANAKVKIKAAIAQFGGPTSVINESMIGAVAELKKRNCTALGMRHGFNGLISNDFYRLDLYSDGKLDEIRRNPGSYLGTSKYNVNDDNVLSLAQKLKQYNINYFYMIGGDSTAKIAKMIDKAAKLINYSLKVVHIPKTIDNDLVITDHTPGYGTAAKYIAKACFGLDQENRSQPGIYLAVTMGRHSGFLAAASSLLRMYDDSGPHLIYLPEKNFVLDNFLSDVENILSRNKTRIKGEWINPRAFIVVSEGIRKLHYDSNGNPMMEPTSGLQKHELMMDIASSELGKQVKIEKNMGISSMSDGSRVLANYFESVLNENFSKNVERIKADVLGYPQRSYPTVSDTDSITAEYVGRSAVKFSFDGNNGSCSVVIERTGEGHTYSIKTSHVPLSIIAGHIKQMPLDYIGTYGKDVSNAFKLYAAPLVGVDGISNFSKDYILPSGFDVGEIIAPEDRWW
jgi:ATP-dependent phosphofructokinase / diphosphate-dependent phosphofructokinase